MAEYTIISDISTYILKTLRDRMSPEPIASPQAIEISSPADQDVDYVLGLYLYDIREENEVATNAYIPSGLARLKKPPRPYSLHYMIFINGSSQMGLKAPDIQKIIGRVAQIVNDNNTVLPSAMQPWLDIPEPPILLTSNRLPLEEKVRIWSAISKPYQVSLFYKASPVFISSEIVVEVPRVSEAIISVGENTRGGKKPGVIEEA